MPDIVKYQQSIGAEFLAQRDRVRYFIDNSHWGEDGRYKESLLSDFLRSIVPDGVGIGTGFVRNHEGELTHQIDILIYQKEYPYLFRAGDFVILMPESVLGIIEVKSNASPSSLSQSYGLTKDKSIPLKKSAIQKCDDNGRIIGRKDIFNGIWGYDAEIKVTSKQSKMRDQLKQSNGYLNHICFNSDVFCRYWESGHPYDRYSNPKACYRFYNLSAEAVFGEKEKNRPGLSYGYFISNLLEMIYRQTAPQALNDQYYEFLYPLEHTKEAYKYGGCDIEVNEHN